MVNADKWFEEISYGAIIKVKYDGDYPCACRGQLLVEIDFKVYDFGNYALSSGGSVSFDEDWYEEVTHGPWKWRIKDNEFPEGFPMHLKDAVLDIINTYVDHGCCGGCV